MTGFLFDKNAAPPSVLKPKPDAELERRDNAKTRIVERLRKGKAKSHELCKPEIGGIRFGARIHELDREGYDIDVSRLDGGGFEYELISEPT